MRGKRRLQRHYYRLIALFSLFQKDLKRDKTTDSEEELEKDDPYFSRIRCPHCKWQPKSSSLWYCGNSGYPEFYFDGCGTAWNTFFTKGLCPGCNHQWRWTACLHCSQWALHEEWYTDKEGN